MARREMPRLGDTPRFYVEDTRRARVKSAGLERYRAHRRRVAPWLAAALLILVAAIAWFYWMTLG
ncbi:MAG TPA: hypothetical protein VFR85_17430 [Anaeromyxobacteraceae bacterium]|nr:hypothetical protein [Anaeromyxobacteraceae bacterium]